MKLKVKIEYEGEVNPHDYPEFDGSNQMRIAEIMQDKLNNDVSVVMGHIENLPFKLKVEWD